MSDHTELPDQRVFNFSHLLQLIMKTWPLVLISVLLAGLAFGGLVSLARIGLPSTYTFQHPVRFIFQDVEKGRYPNGTAFSLNDLVAPVIVQTVYDSNALEKYGIRQREFANALSIQPYSPSLNAVVERYRQRLSNKRLTFAERQSIENDMQRELQEMSHGGALLRLDLRGRFGIPNPLAEKLLLDVVEAWAQVSTEQRGVLKLPESIESQSLVNKSLFETLDYPVAYDFLQTSLARLKRRMTELEVFGGSTTIVDKPSGHTLRSLNIAIRNFEAYALSEISVPIFEYGLSKQPEWSQLYYSARIQSLKFDRDAIAAKVAAVKSGLDEYDASGRLPTSTTHSASSQTGSTMPQSTTIPQFGEAFLDRIMSLTEQSADREFRQSLIREQLGFDNQRIQIATQIKRTEELLAKISRDKSPAGNTTKRLPAGLQENFEKRLSSAVERINQFWSISIRFFQQLSIKRFNHSGRLYSNLEISTGERHFVTHPIWNRTTLWLGLAAFFTAVAAAVFVGLGWQIVRQST